MACLFAGGSYAKQFYIIFRETFDDKLLLLGFTEEKLELFYKENGVIDKPLFEKCIIHVFVLEIENWRKSFDYHGLALLLINGCSCHKS